MMSVRNLHDFVEALSPVTARVISRGQFHGLLDRQPAQSRELLRVFAPRFSLHRLFGLDHCTRSLKERLIKMLYFLSCSHDKDASDTQPIFMKLSQEELGKVVGACRQKLNPALKAPEKEPRAARCPGVLRLFSGLSRAAAGRACDGCSGSNSTPKPR